MPFMFFTTCSRFLGRTIFPPSMKKSMVLSKPAKPIFQARSRKGSFRESVCPSFGAGRGVTFWGRYSRSVYQETAPRASPPKRVPVFNMLLNKWSFNAVVLLLLNTFPSVVYRFYSNIRSCPMKHMSASFWKSFLSFLLNLRKNSQFPILTKLFNMTMIRKMRRCMDFGSTQCKEIHGIERKR